MTVVAVGQYHKVPTYETVVTIVTEVTDNSDRRDSSGGQ